MYGYLQVPNTDLESKKKWSVTATGVESTTRWHCSWLDCKSTIPVQQCWPPSHPALAQPAMTLLWHWLVHSKSSQPHTMIILFGKTACMLLHRRKQAIRQPGWAAAVREAGTPGERCWDGRCLSRFHTIPHLGCLILSESICCQFSTALKYQERIALSQGNTSSPELFNYFHLCWVGVKCVQEWSAGKEARQRERTMQGPAQLISITMHNCSL